MSDCRKCAVFEWCKEHEECGIFYPKTMTNADRIRSMSDEELAKFIASQRTDCYHCPVKECVDACEVGWLDWLKQEASDEN